MFHLGSAIGHPGLDMVNVLDSLRLGEKLGVGHNVMSHNSLIFLANVIEIFPEMDWLYDVHRVKYIFSYLPEMVTAKHEDRAEGQGSQEVGPQWNSVGRVPGEVSQEWKRAGGEGAPHAPDGALEVLTLLVHHVHGPLDPGVGVVDLLLPILSAERHVCQCLLFCTIARVSKEV